MPSTAKLKYKELCERRSDIPLFLQYWWMEAAAKNWDVLFSYDVDGTVRGVFVYSYTTKLGRLLILPSLLTQYSGTWLFYPEGLTTESRYSFENEVYGDLIKQIEALKADFFELNFHYSQRYWQPFYWNGYSQTMRYTYRIEDISDPQAVYDAMSHRKRQKPLAKAADNFELLTDADPSEFYDTYASRLKAKGDKILYTKEAFLKIHNAAVSRGQGSIFTMRDKESCASAVSLFVVWDPMSAYNLVITIDEAYRSSGASTLIVFEVIKHLSSVTKSYDFEGSMIQGVALKNQSFGATLTPFSQITKVTNPVLKLWRLIK